MDVVRKMVSVETGCMLTSCLILLGDQTLHDGKENRGRGNLSQINKCSTDSVTIISDALATTLYALASHSTSPRQDDSGTNVIKQITRFGAWHLIDKRLKDPDIKVCKSK